MLNMSEYPLGLSIDQKHSLLQRFLNRPASELTYGTVRDYCDSSDHISFLAQLQGDLKDLQRPAALKTVVGLLHPGSSLLEVGAGEPVVAGVLSDLGYHVTVVDPYDGSGNGPTDFGSYSSKYPNVQLIRACFSDSLRELEPTTYDCVYSISVLEHVHQPGLAALFRGIRRFLRPGGYSAHFIDHVLAGDGANFHLRQIAEILTLQSELASEPRGQVTIDLINLLNTLTSDNDTYYLSADGHNRWRGSTSYNSFPFRKVVSLHSCKKFWSHSDSPKHERL